VYVLGGIGILWLSGLLLLAAIGASPARGWRVNRALEAGVRGETARAAEELERIVAERPGDAHACLRAGRALREAGRTEEAIARLREAVARDPSSATSHYELAKALAQSELYVEAEKVLEALRVVKPDHGDGLFLGASLAAGRGDVGEAAARFAAAVAAGASDPDRYRNDPRFDAVRDDPTFLAIARDARHPDAFRERRP